MSILSWTMSSQLLGTIIAYLFGCISGVIGGNLWRRMRQVEDRIAVLEEHEHEQEGNGPDDI